MERTSNYIQVYNMVKALGGKIWAFYGDSVLYIKDGKLRIYRVKDKYSVTVNEFWCKRWLITGRQYSTRNLPILP